MLQYKLVHRVTDGTSRKKNNPRTVIWKWNTRVVIQIGWSIWIKRNIQIGLGNSPNQWSNGIKIIYLRQCFTRVLSLLVHKTTTKMLIPKPDLLLSAHSKVRSSCSRLLRRLLPGCPGGTSGASFILYGSSLLQPSKDCEDCWRSIVWV